MPRDKKKKWETLPFILTPPTIRNVLFSLSQDGVCLVPPGSSATHDIQLSDFPDTEKNTTSHPSRAKSSETFTQKKKRFSFLIGRENGNEAIIFYIIMSELLVLVCRVVEWVGLWGWGGWRERVSFRSLRVCKPINPLNQPFNFNIQKYNNIFSFAVLC